MELLTSRVGPDTLSDGSKARARTDRTGALVVNVHGRRYETAKRGLLYTATTAAGGVAPGTTIGTAAAFALVNPTDSGIDLVILSIGLGYISGTIGAGSVMICRGAPNSTAVTGTAIVTQSGRFSTAPGRAAAYTTATLPATPTAVGVFCNLNAMLATTATMPAVVRDDVEGKYIVPPEWSFSLQGVATAGTAPLLVYELCWLEVPV